MMNAQAWQEYCVHSREVHQGLYRPWSCAECRRLWERILECVYGGELAHADIVDGGRDTSGVAIDKRAEE